MATVVNPGRPLSTSELLDARPLRNRTVRIDSGRDGERLLCVPLRRKWYTQPPLSWVLPFSTHRRIALDTLGWEVWECCDGAATTEQIVERFAERHRLTFHEARLSVMQFLKMLTQRGLIVMVGAPSREASP